MNPKEKENEALEFARVAHGSQRRKYKDEAYIEHPKRVAALVKTVPHTSEMICAAYLHDVVEDTPVTLKEIESKFGTEVAQLVDELTDEFIKESYPHLNRRRRKEKETERQANTSEAAKTIKLADVIDNTPDISQNDPAFARRYIPEMDALVKALQGGDPTLYVRAQNEVEIAKKLLKNSK